MEEAEESEEIRFVKKYLAKHGRLRALKALNKDLERKKMNDECKPVRLSFAIQKAPDKKKENEEPRKAKKGSKKAKKLEEKQSVSILKDSDQNSTLENDAKEKPMSLSFTILKAPKRKVEELVPVKPTKSTKKSKDLKEEKTETIPKEFKKLAKNFGLPEEHLDFFYENRSSFNWECKDKTIIHCAEKSCKYQMKGSSSCLFDHVISVHDYKDIPCDQLNCKYIAYSMTNLTLHRRSFHGHGRRPSDFGNHKCPYSYCNNSFRNQTDLRRHLDVHENRFYSCKFCPYRCVRKNKLSFHLNLHFNIKKYACDLCSKAFNAPETLGVHMRCVHSNDDYVCPDCGFITQKRRQYLLHRGSCAKRLEHSRIL